jgi:hypothetical protein
MPRRLHVPMAFQYIRTGPTNFTVQRQWRYVTEKDKTVEFTYRMYQPKQSLGKSLLKQCAHFSNNKITIFIVCLVYSFGLWQVSRLT